MDISDRAEGKNSRMELPDRFRTAVFGHDSVLAYRVFMEAVRSPCNSTYSLIEHLRYAFGKHSRFGDIFYERKKIAGGLSFHEAFNRMAEWEKNPTPSQEQENSGRVWERCDDAKFFVEAFPASRNIARGPDISQVRSAFGLILDRYRGPQ